MLKLRILSALVLIPLMLWALFAWPLAGFAAFLGFFIVVAAWEWSRLAGMATPDTRMIYVGLVVSAGVGLYLLPFWIGPLLILAVLFWLWAFIELLVARSVNGGALMSRPGKLLGGFLVLLPAWMVPVALRMEPHGEWLTLYSLVLVWVADTGAYFAGHRFGRHKLAPAISPGKTWEGVAGGLVAVLFLALLFGQFGWHWGPVNLAMWVTLSLVVALVSVLGDLFESRLKRAAGVKDSGTFIPGHGGVLDRIDAYTAAAPTFALAWYVWRALAGGS